MYSFLKRKLTEPKEPDPFALFISGIETSIKRGALTDEVMHVIVDQATFDKLHSAKTIHVNQFGHYVWHSNPEVYIVVTASGINTPFGVVFSQFE